MIWSLSVENEVTIRQCIEGILGIKRTVIFQSLQLTNLFLFCYSLSF